MKIKSLKLTNWMPYKGIQEINFPDDDNANILIMGFSFKENCPDIRNSKIPDLIKGIKKYCPNVDVYDPLVNKKNVKKIYGIDLIEKPIKRKYNAIVIALAHDSFKKLTLSFSLNSK